MINEKRRKIADTSRISGTIFSTALCVIVLLSIIIYIFVNGFKALSWKLISGDYESKTYSVTLKASDEPFEDPGIKNAYFSSKYGISIADTKDTGGEAAIVVKYVCDNSPFKNGISTDLETKGDTYKLESGMYLSLMIGEDLDGEYIQIGVKKGAKAYAETLDETSMINSIQLKTEGGGIRGSLLTTILLILVTLVIALPLGVFSSIFLTLYLPDSKFKTILSTMIDMTSGIPSIIFGFCGAIIFIPFVTSIGGKSGYTVLAGALTMTIILLPTIIKTTNEALLVIPSHYQMASLALGASKTQTIFKVIVPNAIPGILTSALLSIGRIIGESAALIFVMGTNISDHVSLLNGATSLSLHIWNITSSENPNYEIACAISIIILIVVFIMSISVKLISKKINKMEVKG